MIKCSPKIERNRCGNHLLNALPTDALDRLVPHMQLTDLPLGMVLHEAGDTLCHIYFPTDSIVSLLYVMENGASAEIAVVGNDGAVGMALFMGNMLGVRREGVTAAACKLRALSVIAYVRGRITVVDRERLEGLSCECYAAVKTETDRLSSPEARLRSITQEAPPTRGGRGKHEPPRASADGPANRQSARKAWSS